MAVLGHHISIRLRSDQVLAPSDSERRLAARAILKHGRWANLVNFSVPDTHGHLYTAADLRTSNELARRVELSLGRCLGLSVGFERARVRPVRDVWHGSNLFDYVFNQYRHHGLDWDPVFEGTNLPDLLGLRLIGDYTIQNVRQNLPRLKQERLFDWFGCPPLAPADGPPELLLEAAASAAALPSLSGSSREELTTRRALVEIAQGQLQQVEIADLLQISRTSLYRLRQRPVNPRLVQAIRLQLGLREVLENASTSANGIRCSENTRSLAAE